MLADDETEAKVIRIIELVCDNSFVDRDTYLNFLNIDSVDYVELIMKFEEEFDINIPDETIEGFKTVGDIIEYIESHIR